MALVGGICAPPGTCSSYMYILQYSGETSVLHIHVGIVYVYHVFVANHLTGVQMDIFIRENDFKFFCFTRD